MQTLDTTFDTRIVMKVFVINDETSDDVSVDDIINLHDIVMFDFRNGMLGVVIVTIAIFLYSRYNS